MIIDEAAVVDTKVTRLYMETIEAKTPIVIHYGGAGSSKSHSIAQVLEDAFTGWDHRKILVTRKTLPALKLTAEKMVLDILKKDGFYDACDHNKGDRVLKFGNSMMVFSSTDDPEKRKSEEWTDVWMEEATEFTKEDFNMIRSRMRAPVAKDQPRRIYMSLNPVDINSWIKALTAKPHVTAIHSTYHDNPFLDDDYREILEGYKDEDDMYYRVMTLGEWGSHEGIIYPDWEYCDSIPDGERIRVIDFGYTAPTAYVELTKVDNTIYIDELFYEKGLSHKQAYERIAEIGNIRTKTICDNEDPRFIDYLHSKGVNVHPADKGPGSVFEGIMTVKRYNIKLTKRSTNIESERRKYRWKTDKNGMRFDAPVKIDDHAMDALRYGIYTEWHKERIKYTHKEHEPILDSDFSQGW